jgi:hypothetical protein
METHFLLAFGEEEFLAPLAITWSEAFFNKLLGATKHIAGAFVQSAAAATPQSAPACISSSACPALGVILSHSDSTQVSPGWDCEPSSADDRGPLTMRLGVLTSRDWDLQLVEDILGEADSARYHAKADVPNCVRLGQPIALVYLSPRSPNQKAMMASCTLRMGNFSGPLCFQLN